MFRWHPTVRSYRVLTLLLFPVWFSDNALRVVTRSPQDIYPLPFLWHLWYFQNALCFPNSPDFGIKVIHSCRHTLCLWHVKLHTDNMFIETGHRNIEDYWIVQKYEDSELKLFQAATSELKRQGALLLNAVIDCSCASAMFSDDVLSFPLKIQGKILPFKKDKMYSIYYLKLFTCTTVKLLNVFTT